jgi:hypothetical protein
MVVRMSVLHAGRLYPQEDSWYSFLSKAESTPRDIVRLEGLGELKNPMTSGIEPATFQLVVRLPHFLDNRLTEWVRNVAPHTEGRI